MEPWNPGNRTLTLWTLLYSAASLLFCSPLLSLDTFATSLDKGDVRLIAWTLAWHARWPLTAEWPLDAPFFAPEPQALAYSDPMIGLGLLAAPVTIAFGPIVSFNTLRILIPVINALAMALLVWHYLRDPWASVVSGFALACAYSQIATIYIGLVHLATLAGFLLTALFLDRWWQQAQTRDLVAALGFAIWQALMSWYAAVIALVAMTIQLAWLVAFDRRATRSIIHRIVYLAGSAAIAVALVWPMARPFLGAPRPAREEFIQFSLQPENYLQAPTDTLVGGWMNGGATTNWDYRRSYFVGVTAGLAAFAGVIGAVARRDAARRLLWAVPLIVFGFALSLGPSSGDHGWRPFDVLMAIPGVSSFRVPGRMSVLVPIGIAMLVGIAMHRVPRRAQWWVAIVLLGLFVGEGYMAHLARPEPQPLTRPAIFRELERERPTRLLILPMLGSTPRWPDEADYPLFALPTWTPVANGYGRRTPAIYEALAQAVPEFPGGSLGDALRYYGFTHVIILPGYTDDGGAALKAAATASKDLELAAQIDNDVLYRVLPH